MTDVKHLEMCVDEEAQRNLRPKRTNFEHQQVYLDISDQEDEESIYDDEKDISDSENLPEGKEDSAESVSSISATAGGGCIKRKRRITKDQRLAANKRERKRMLSLNSAFERLKKSVPVFPHERKLSRIQTLRLAMTYISFMTDLLWDTSFPSKHTNLVPMQQYHQALPLQMSFGPGNPRHIGHHQHHQYTQHLQGQQVSCQGDAGGLYLSY